MSDIGCLVEYQEKPIVNYMLLSDSSTFFLESVSTGEQSHDAKWIAQDMGRVIDSLARKMKAQTSKSTADREPTWLSAASSNALRVPWRRVLKA
ncbi:hypothetical protein BASA50_000343 [Batrachochytrium salamandrivorans]|uniref:Uncharacterized protein n=1 Tax=Batrachochytrium salamandrivorans TaxID=1357716 RepID=A0ABQ8EU38_9FUNG|nr:hypothetical protein BASA50_000343 [Batrachochytrium salamandrivorans]